MSHARIFNPRKLWLAWYAFQFATRLVTASQPHAPTCYHLDGSPYSDVDEILPDGTIRKWVSCNPDQAISHYCYSVDLYLDNGLCMDFGSPGDRLLTLQGCTDAAWREPCLQYFAKHRYDTLGADGRVLIWVCSYDSGGEYCVGIRIAATGFINASNAGSMG